MAELDEIGVTAGIPDTGTGEVPTLAPVRDAILATNTALATIDGRVDGIEALIGTTNTTLTTIDGRVDGLETLITSTNAKLDTMTTALQIIDNFVGTQVNAGNSDANTQRVTLASNDVMGAAIVDAIETAASPVVNLEPATSGGLTIHRSLDLDESEEEVKATAGQVYGMWVANRATSTRYIKFYNDTAANVTVGTTAPVLTIPIPGNSSDDIAGVFNAGSHGIAFSTAISVAATTSFEDNDTGAPSANDVVVNIFFK
jgi:hypothetical protein